MAVSVCSIRRSRVLCSLFLISLGILLFAPLVLVGLLASSSGRRAPLRFDFSTAQIPFEGRVRHEGSKLRIRSQSFVPEHGIPIWVFFYLWYGNPQHDDGHYWHWTHPILPHWDAKVAAKYPDGIIEAPLRVATPGGVRPARGLYSSRDRETLADQMSELKRAGVAGAIVSWWGRNGESDDNGPPTEPLHMKRAFEAAEEHGIKISVHLEPYPGRTAESACEDLAFLLDRYGRSSAWDPRIYVYDSYLTPAHDWKRTMSRCPARRQVNLLALILNPGDVVQVASPGGFDGVYTYFAAAGFTAASDPKSWQRIAEMTCAAGLSFVPCVGPGYDDTTIRPWNFANRRDRRGGMYFREMWSRVPRSAQCIESVAITSYNEWAEGTMIEPTTEENGGLYMDILKEFKWR